MICLVIRKKNTTNNAKTSDPPKAIIVYNIISVYGVVMYFHKFKAEVLGSFAVLFSFEINVPSPLSSADDKELEISAADDVVLCKDTVDEGNVFSSLVVAVTGGVVSTEESVATSSCFFSVSVLLKKTIIH